MKFFLIAIFCFLTVNDIRSEEVHNASEDIIADTSHVLDSLPPYIQNIVKLSPKQPIGCRIMCRIRSLSTRNINITHVLHDGPPVTMKMMSGKITTLSVHTNETLKINEVLSFGDGDDSTEILGEVLATYVMTENSVSYTM